ncbi:hypothetical protein GOP47_0014110 [Adiantum capillus-veneris]|uniref:Uncharacterized protein n=1 Tax=Adiantum capillus-veneris TaxID=13818 RepID=A0A9D4ZE09_ADICA|nr:hypothetical protein GOP47_0014110 [Adiantum capillus-veneris]
MEAQSSRVVVDDNGRIRLLNPSEFFRSREIAQACASFRTKILHFHQMSKQILDQVGEEAQKVESAKQEAIDLRHSVALEIASRPQRLKDQREEITCLQEELDRLITEYESLATVRREQELLLAQLTYTNAST